MTSKKFVNHRLPQVVGAQQQGVPIVTKRRHQFEFCLCTSLGERVKPGARILGIEEFVILTVVSQRCSEEIELI